VTSTTGQLLLVVACLANLALLGALHFGVIKRRLRWLPLLALVWAVFACAVFLMVTA